MYDSHSFLLTRNNQKKLWHRHMIECLSNKILRQIFCTGHVSTIPHSKGGNFPHSRLAVCYFHGQLFRALTKRRSFRKGGKFQCRSCPFLPNVTVTFMFFIFTIQLFDFFFIVIHVSRCHLINIENRNRRSFLSVDSSDKFRIKLLHT